LACGKRRTARLPPGLAVMAQPLSLLPQALLLAAAALLMPQW
jgi:hypothetical protein